MGLNEFEAGVVGRIKASMKTRGLTQEELAKSVGVKQYAVSRMLSGSPFPSGRAAWLDRECLGRIPLLPHWDPRGINRELSMKTRKVADAYQFANPMVKEIIKRLLVIK